MILDTLKRMLGRTPPDGVHCEEALARIHEFLDGELPTATEESVAEHFRVCNICYPHLRLEQEFRRRVQVALEKPDVPDGLRSRVLEMLEEEPGWE